MSQQAQELEDRLQRLSVSIPPRTTVVDPDATQVREAGVNSFPGQSFSQQAPTIVTDVPQIVPKRSTPVLLIVAVIVILGLSGVGTGAYFILRSKRVTTPPITKPPVEDPQPVPSPDLVQIDGGTFEMGRNGGTPGEGPPHPIDVQTFFMDKTEVTNAEYAIFVRDTNHAAPGYWWGTKPPLGQERWPVVSVSQQDANEFAAWRSKREGAAYRLPTEEEWEYAARNGPQGDLYPWGKEWQEGNAVVKEGSPSPVGSRPQGKNKWGVVDLIGNVWEWTSSKVSAYPGNPTVIPTATRDLVTIRGACYVSDPAKVEAPITSSMREFIPASTKNPLLGFRLVRSGS
jgi:formylglycine-generating enzyme required for sulfatase activity